MSRNQKVGVGTGIAVAMLVLTIIATGSGMAGGIVKFGKLEQAISGHEKRLDKMDRAVEVLYTLDGKIDILIKNMEK